MDEEYNKDKDKNINEDKVDAKNKPNDSGAVSVEGHIRVFDPNTNEVFVNKRS